MTVYPPRVLVIVVGEDSMVVDDDGALAEELRQVQGQLFQVPSGGVFIHVGTDQDDLAALLPKTDAPEIDELSDSFQFNIVHVVSRASSSFLDVDQLLSPEQMAELVVGTSCRLVVISGEGGELFVEPLVLAIERIDASLPENPERRLPEVAGFPASRTTLEDRVNFVREFYFALADSTSARLSICAGNAAMAVATRSMDEPPMAHDAVALPAKAILLQPRSSLDFERPDLGFDDSVLMWWRPRSWASAVVFEAAPQLESLDFAFVSWVRVNDPSRTHVWADSRGWGRSPKTRWPTFPGARGWAVGTYRGEPLLHLNSDDPRVGRGDGRDDWYGENYVADSGIDGSSHQIADGKFHCVVQNVIRSEPDRFEWFVDGTAIRGRERDMAHYKLVDFSGSELVLGIGKDHIRHRYDFDGELLLFAIIPRVVRPEEAQELTDHLERTLWSDPSVS